MLNDDEIKLLIQSLGAQVLENQRNPTGAVAVLIVETVRFRDQLREQAGTTLTVGDTRAALEALEQYLAGGAPSGVLTSEQSALLQLYIDRLTLFKHT
jgi:hypothetical protein